MALKLQMQALRGWGSFRKKGPEGRRIALLSVLCDRATMRSTNTSPLIYQIYICSISTLPFLEKHIFRKFSYSIAQPPPWISSPCERGAEVRTMLPAKSSFSKVRTDIPYQLLKQSNHLTGKGMNTTIPKLATEESKAAFLLFCTALQLLKADNAVSKAVSLQSH